ncbi:ImuA family protein [Sphingobium sp.]|uniref:ImuA family protein n=1 Tax=Sphingobium sp. TaxID=1912891 RepID=UPI003B3B297A
MPHADMPFPTLGRGHLHEVHNAMEDRAAAILFALAQGHGGSGAIFAFRTPRRMHVPTIFSGDGLASCGVDPARLTIVDAKSEVDMLRAGLEAARCPGVAMIMFESDGRFADYDLTASRRLVLAAEASGAIIFMLRGGAEQRSSGAQTRWMIRSVPSAPLEANAPGLPMIEAELLRCRNGPAGGRWRLSWDADNGCFRDNVGAGEDEEKIVPGTMVPFSRLRTDARGDGDAARQVA